MSLSLGQTLQVRLYLYVPVTPPSIMWVPALNSHKLESYRAISHGKLKPSHGYNRGFSSSWGYMERGLNWKNLLRCRMNTGLSE